MKHLCAFVGLFLLVSVAWGQSSNPAASMIVAKTIRHPDGTRSESVRDPVTRQVTETTYDASDVVVSRRMYLLNERGQATQGSIYDGSGNLVARSVSYFDEFGRAKEDRLLNTRGEVFQQTVYEYGADGKQKKPRVVNFNVQTPTMKPAMVDFTQSTAPPDAGAAQPTTGTPAATPTPPAEEKPKKNFFKRLFEGKK
jgi:hypothetical protein